MLSPCWGTLDVTAILMAATAWLMSFKSCIVCGFDSYTVIFSGDTWKSTVYGSIPHTIRDLKDNISHAVAAIKIAMLHRVYLDVISRAQLCIDAGGNHLQHLIWWYLATVLISVFTLCYGPGLLFRGPPCTIQTHSYRVTRRHVPKEGYI